MQAPNALVISPNGDQRLLPLTQEMVMLAPRTPEWEFHAAKPPKRWDLRFVVEDVRGQPVEVDANTWEYVLLKASDGLYDVAVHAPSIDDLDQETKQLAAEVAIEGVVGETARLRHIGGVEVVGQFNDLDRRKSTKLKYLGDHLKSLISS